MAESERSTASPRSGFVPICASSWSFLCLLLSGCLNPMPEEFPVRPGTESAPDRGSPGDSVDYSGDPTDENASPGADGESEPSAPDVEGPPDLVATPEPSDPPDAGPADAGPAELVSEP